MPIEPPLRELPQGGLKLGAEWHRKLVRRIEHIVPVAKKKGGIKVEPRDEGHVLSLDGSVGNPVTYTVVSLYQVTPSVTVTVETLLVCSGGNTTTMYILTATGGNLQSLVGQTARLIDTSAPLRLIPADPPGFGAGDTAPILHGTQS